MACQITYKNKKYDYEGFMSLLAKGEFNSLVENGSIDVSKLKGEYEDAVKEWVKSESSLGEHKGIVQGQQEVGEREGGKRETEKPETDRSDSVEPSKEKEIKYSFTAWHGSPHEFDKFSTEKIGTGEGAQAFGWGLYFTDVKDIARYYAENILPFNAPSLIYSVALTRAIEAGTGVEIGKMTDRTKFDKQKALDFINNDRGKSWSKEIKEWVLSIIENEDITKIGRFIYKVKILQSKKGYAVAPLQSLDQKWNVYSNEMMDKINSLQNKQGVLDNLKDYPPIKRFDTKDEAIKWISENTEYNWIEWDKPLTSDQKKAIKDELYKEFKHKPLAIGLSVNELSDKSTEEGRSIYQKLARIFRTIDYKQDEQKLASLFLNRAGIDGIKYPAESLSGKPTRGFNYVVFDENAVTIEEQIKFSLSDELTDVKKSLDNLVAEGVYTKGQVQGLLDKVKKNFEDLQAGGKPTSADVSFAYLMELIKLKGEKHGEKQFRVLAKEIADLLKNLLDAKERKFINSRTYQSIFNRMSRANTTEKRQKILNYINDIVIFGKGAKYKARLAEAKEWKDKIADNNKKEKSKFGSARSIADSVVNIDLNELTYEQLDEFTKIAKMILPAGKEVDIQYLIVLNDAFGEIQKEKEEKQIDKIDTIDKLKDYVEKLKQLPITDVPSYIKFLRTYNAMVRKANVLKELLKGEENATQKEEDKLDGALIDFIKSIEEQTKKFKEELDGFKKKYLNLLISRMRGTYVREGLEKIEDIEEAETAKDILDSNTKDIEALDISQLASLNTSLNNIAIGEVTPQFMELVVQIHKNKYKRTNDKFAQTEAKNSNLWKKGIDRKGQTWIKRNLPKFMFNQKKITLLRELTERFKTKQPGRWGITIGNLSFTKKIGALNAYIGEGMNEEQIDEGKYREDLGRVVNKHLQPNRTAEEQNTWLHRITMFLMEARWYDATHDKSTQSYLHSIFVKSQEKDSGIKLTIDDPVSFGEKVNEYNQFLEYIKSKDSTAIKIVDGQPILDIEKVEAILRKEKGLGEVIDFVRDTFKRYRGRHKWISKYNGRSLIYEDNYFPFMKEGGADEIDNLENTESWLRKASYNVNMVAGSTYEWTKQLFEPNLELLDILLNHTKMVRRNYYVYPKVREHILSVKESADDIIKEEGVTKANNVDIIARAVINATRSRISALYNLNNEKALSKALKFAELGLKKGYLVTPEKFATETATNIVRISLAMTELSPNVYVEYKKHMKIYDSMISKWIDEKMWSAYSPEVSPKMFQLFGKKYGVKYLKKYAQKGEQLQDWFLKTPDKGAGKLLFINSLKDSFRGITGEEFDVEKYYTDIKYQLKFREAVEESEIFALSRVEELFNSKNPLSTVEKIQFMNGLIRADRNNAFTRMFGFLQSFGSNDAQQVVDSYIRMRYGDKKMKAMARRDLLAVITSNFMYGILRRMASVVMKSYVYFPLWYVIKGALGLGGDDDDKDADQKYIDETKQKIFSGDFIWKYGTYKVALDLLWGGSTNVYEYFGKIGLFIFETSEGLTDEQKQFVYDFFKTRYMDRIPYGKFSNDIVEKGILVAMPPMVTGITEDFLSATHSLIEFNYGHIAEALMVALTDAEASGVITKKDLYDISNVIFTGFKYTGCLPFSSVPEYFIRQELNKERPLYLKQRRIENKGQTQETGKTTTQAVD